MTIEHVAITDPNIHEPKGVAIAGANTVYHADGSGSGTWRKTSSTDLQGVSGDSGVSGKFIVSDGANGFIFRIAEATGAMVITNNSTNAALTAVADNTFNTASQFTLMTGTGFPWTSENLSNVTFNTDRLTVTETGVYLLATYLNINSFPSSSARVAMRFRINGSTFGIRKPTVKSGGAGSELQLIGTELVALNAGDYVQNYIATDATGNILIKDANITIHLVS